MPTKFHQNPQRTTTLKVWRIWKPCIFLTTVYIPEYFCSWPVKSPQNLHLACSIERFDHFAWGCPHAENSHIAILDIDVFLATIYKNIKGYEAGPHLSLILSTPEVCISAVFSFSKVLMAGSFVWPAVGCGSLVSMLTGTQAYNTQMNRTMACLPRHLLSSTMQNTGMLETIFFSITEEKKAEN